MKHKEQRVAVLIDVQNMYYSARNLFGSRVNFGQVLEDVLAKRMLVRAIAYVVRTKTGEEKPFFDALTKIGIETREKDLQEFFGGAKKADWDVGITIDAVKLSKKVDVVVLVSGDGDFCPLVEYLKNSGCFVEIAAFGETASLRLVEISDDFINLSESQEKYLIKPKNSGKSMIIRKGKRMAV
jgi:uncharacterized LabA/DUF88 family protein